MTTRIRNELDLIERVAEGRVTRTGHPHATADLRETRCVIGELLEHLSDGDNDTQASLDLAGRLRKIAEDWGEKAAAEGRLIAAIELQRRRRVP